MKRLILAIVAAVILSVFLVGCTQPEVKTTQLHVIKNFIEPVETSDIKVDAAIVEKDSMKFTDFSHHIAGTKITFNGKLEEEFSKKPISNQEVKIFCNDKQAGTGLSNIKGEFSVVVDRANCLSGDKAYAVADDEVSKELSIPVRMFGSKSSFTENTRRSTTESTPANQVPEYSTITLGLTAAISLLGILYLRK